MRHFLFKTKAWSKGLEVHVYEIDGSLDGSSVGVTQIYGTSRHEAWEMAEDYVRAQLGLSIEQFTMTYAEGEPN